jgi:hypothetical protein
VAYVEVLSSKFAWVYSGNPRNTSSRSRFEPATYKYKSRVLELEGACSVFLYRRNILWASLLEPITDQENEGGLLEWIQTFNV